MYIPKMTRAPGRQPVMPSNTKIENLEKARGNGMMWFGFWIFAAVFIVCDTWVFSKGYDSFLQTHKTAKGIEILKKS